MHSSDQDEIQRGFKFLAQEPVEPDSMARMMATVRNQKTKESRMKSMAFKGVVVGGLIMAIIAALILIPASYTVTVGSLATVVFLPNEGVKAVDVAAAISLPGTQKLMTLDNGLATMTIAARGMKPAQLEAAVNAGIAPLKDKLNGLKIEIEPITEQHGGNALAAMTSGQIIIGVNGLTDSEIEARIASALQAHGMNVRNVQVKTDSSTPGRIERQVRIEADAPEGTEAPDLQIGDDGVGKGTDKRVVVKREWKEKWRTGDSK
jgi:hypothetical protein